MSSDCIISRFDDVEDDDGADGVDVMEILPPLLEDSADAGTVGNFEDVDVFVEDDRDLDVFLGGVMSEVVIFVVVE